MYQQRLRAANALDFDDLIMTTVHLFQAFPEVRETYRRRFRHVLVDEYQDTNHAQYALIRELCGHAVGRPAATGRRRPRPARRRRRGRAVGADGRRRRRPVDLRVPRRQHPQHPRSSRRTSRTRARSCWSRTTARPRPSSTPPTRSSSATRAARPRTCGPTPGAGEQIVGYVADDEHDEARFVADEIDRLTDAGVAKPRDVAVFYRTNAQSRVFEEVFIRVGLPYKVVGGVRFYERREVRDALAYLRMLANPADEISLRRVAQRAQAGDRRAGRGLRRGAGPARRDHLLGGAAPRRRGARHRDPVASPRSARSSTIVEELQSMVDAGERADVVLEQTLARSGYLAELEASDDPQDETRVENLAELVAVAREFSDEPVPPPSADPADLDAGLARRTRVPGAGRAGRRLRPDPRPGRRGHRRRHADDAAHRQGAGVPGRVPHRAGGRRLPAHALARRPAELEEERRLAYVGLTRAQQRLYLSRARGPLRLGGARRTTRRPGSSTRCRSTSWTGGAPQAEQTSWNRPVLPSLPARRRRAPPRRGSAPPRSARTPSARRRRRARSRRSTAGDRVSHDSFGMGSVVTVEGAGDKAVASIDFGSQGVKRLLLRYAPVEKL